MVGIGTIPIIDYCKIFNYNCKFLHQQFSIHTVWDLEEFQKKLSDRLADINTRICHENKAPQLIPGYGSVSPSNMYWHQYVEKTYYCGSGINKRLCKRIPDSATVDGCHASLGVSTKWYEGLHKCYMANINKIENLSH